jgi:hypothetical protein
VTDLPAFLIERGGLWGLIVLGLLVQLHRLEAERTRLTAKIETEHQNRLNDAKENTKALLETSERTHVALERLADLAEFPPKRAGMKSRPDL